ncbi:MAG: hypothetical protein J6Q78_01880 [Clostridia bacterium]|nr:hypothetical protein [Clostridia bacterium]
MTREEIHVTKNRYKPLKTNRDSVAKKPIISALMCGFILFLLLKNPAIATASVKKGLSLCVGSLLPSLFPFMIVSELSVKSGLASYPARLLEKPSRKILGMSGDAGCAFVVGTLCGFPIGARMGMSLYEQGKLTLSELTRLVCLSSNAGLAFTVITLGRERLGSTKIGILLYSAIVLSSIMVGVIAKWAFPPSFSEKASYYLKEKKTTTPSIALLLTESVKSSSLAMLYVCGFVTFFSTVSGSLGAIFKSYFSMPDAIISLIFGALELTGGLFSLDTALPHSVLLSLYGAILGFSGLSVHFQIISVCDTKNGETVKYLPLFCAKLLASAISFLLLLVISQFLCNCKGGLI